MDQALLSVSAHQMIHLRLAPILHRPSTLCKQAQVPVGQHLLLILRCDKSKEASENTLDDHYVGCALSEAFRAILSCHPAKANYS